MNQVWYVKKKTRKFHEKNASRLFKIIDFKSTLLLGKIGLFFCLFVVVVVVVFVYLFCREKINQLKASKIPRSFLLT